MTNRLVLPNHVRKAQDKAKGKLEKQLTNAYQYIIALERFVISYANPELMGPKDLEFLQTMAEKYRPEDEDVPADKD